MFRIDSRHRWRGEIFGEGKKKIYLKKQTSFAFLPERTSVRERTLTCRACGESLSILTPQKRRLPGENESGVFTGAFHAAQREHRPGPSRPPSFATAQCCLGSSGCRERSLHPGDRLLHTQPVKLVSAGPHAFLPRPAVCLWPLDCIKPHK